MLQVRIQQALPTTGGSRNARRVDGPRLFRCATTHRPGRLSPVSAEGLRPVG